MTPGTQDVIGIQQGGVRLRITDPTFVVAALAFLVSLVTIAIVERRGERPQPVSGAAAARGE